MMKSKLNTYTIKWLINWRSLPSSKSEDDEDDEDSCFCFLGNGPESKMTSRSSSLTSENQKNNEIMKIN